MAKVFNSSSFKVAEKEQTPPIPAFDDSDEVNPLIISSLQDIIRTHGIDAIREHYNKAGTEKILRDIAERQASRTHTATFKRFSANYVPRDEQGNIDWAQVPEGTDQLEYHDFAEGAGSDISADEQDDNLEAGAPIFGDDSDDTSYSVRSPNPGLRIIGPPTSKITVNSPKTEECSGEHGCFGLSADPEYKSHYKSNPCKCNNTGVQCVRCKNELAIGKKCTLCGQDGKVDPSEARDYTTEYDSGFDIPGTATPEINNDAVLAHMRKPSDAKIEELGLSADAAQSSFQKAINEGIVGADYLYSGDLGLGSTEDTSSVSDEDELYEPETPVVKAPNGPTTHLPGAASATEQKADLNPVRTPYGYSSETPVPEKEMFIKHNKNCVCQGTNSIGGIDTPAAAALRSKVNRDPDKLLAQAEANKIADPTQRQLAINKITERFYRCPQKMVQVKQNTPKPSESKEMPAPRVVNPSLPKSLIKEINLKHIEDRPKTWGTYVDYTFDPFVTNEKLQIANEQWKKDQSKLPDILRSPKFSDAEWNDLHQFALEERAVTSKGLADAYRMIDEQRAKPSNVPGKQYVINPGREMTGLDSDSGETEVHDIMENPENYEEASEGE